MYNKTKAQVIMELTRQAQLAYYNNQPGVAKQIIEKVKRITKREQKLLDAERR
jgi:hypothetical protein